VVFGAPADGEDAFDLAGLPKLPDHRGNLWTGIRLLR